MFNTTSLTKKLIFIALSVLSLAFVVIAFSIMCLVGEVEIFGVANAIQYSWIMFLFIPASICILAWSIKLLALKNKLGWLGIIITLFVIPTLLIFGSFCLIFHVDNSLDFVQDIEVAIQYDLPDDLNAITVGHSSYEDHRIKIEDAEQKRMFDQGILLDDRWTDTLTSEIRSTMPTLPEAETRDFDYYLFYNETTQAYNQIPVKGISQSCYMLAYNVDLGAFYVIHYSTGE